MNRLMGAWAAVMAVALSGCVPLIVAETTSITNTKKSLVDHAVSSAVGEDCSMVNLSQIGQYCREQITVERPPVYCTKTLGGVDCHDKPDPYRNGSTPLGSPPPVRVIHRDKALVDNTEPQ
jgi:hypothetical protein